MGSRKRKPLSDITDIHNLTPLSVLRELVASNGICKPPVSILKSNSNSTNHKFCPESSDRSNTSIGSSSVGATFNSKTVQFQQTPPAVSPITSPGDVGTKDAAYNRRHNIEKSNKEREAHVLVSRTSIEKRKDKGKEKAIAVPLSSSASEKMKDTPKRNCNMAFTDGGMGIQNVAYDQRQTTEKSRKERMSDVSAYHTSVMERKDKGKAIAVPYNSLSTGKLKKTQNIACSSSTLVERSSQRGLGNLNFSNGFSENVNKTNKDRLVSYSDSSGKTEQGKTNLRSSDCALGKKSEIGKDIAGTSCFSLEKINYKKEEISKRTRSSIVKIKEIGEEYLNPSTSLVGGAKDRPKFVNITDSLPDKTKGEGKVILEPSNIRGASATVAIKSLPSRKTSEKNKNAVGVSSCPQMMRTKKIQNDLDEAGDVKYLKSWTDPQAKVRKKRCSRTDKTSELPEEFIREQKAYFDDVDNFELPVEEVSQDELD